MAHMAYMMTDKKAVKTIENFLKRKDANIKGARVFHDEKGWQYICGSCMVFRMKESIVNDEDDVPFIITATKKIFAEREGMTDLIPFPDAKAMKGYIDASPLKMPRFDYDYPGVSVSAQFLLDAMMVLGSGTLFYGDKQKPLNGILAKSPRGEAIIMPRRNFPINDINSMREHLEEDDDFGLRHSRNTLQDVIDDYEMVVYSPAQQGFTHAQVYEILKAAYESLAQVCLEQLKRLKVSEQKKEEDGTDADEDAAGCGC